MSAITGDQIVRTAEHYSGVKYFEGNPQSRENGFDCSGLVQQVMKDLGYNIARTTTGQLADANTKVIGLNIGTDIGKAQQGDILHYTGHEEIWLGNLNYGGTIKPMVFSEATPGTFAAVRPKTPWPLIGIVRYAGNPGFSSGPGNTFVGGDPGKVSGPLTGTPIGDALDKIYGAVNGLGGFLAAVGGFLTAAGNPGFWSRVGLGILGAALLILGLHALTTRANVVTVASTTLSKAVPRAS